MVIKKDPSTTLVVDSKKRSPQSKDEPQLLIATSGSDKALESISAEVLALHQKIQQLVVNLLFAMVIAGRQLILAKGYLPHGQFTDWVGATFDGAISIRTAQRYMMVASFVRDNMSKLRAELQLQLPDLDVSQLDDETVLRKLSAGFVMKVIAKEKSEKLEKLNSNANLTIPRALSPSFVEGVEEFLETLGLVATSIELSPGEITSTEIVTGNAPLESRKEWPKKLFAILRQNASTVKSIETISHAYSSGHFHEGLTLVPIALAGHEALAKRPQLIFTNTVPFHFESGKLQKDAMTLVLFADEARVAAFASSFADQGIVKVSYALSN